LRGFFATTTLFEVLFAVAAPGTIAGLDGVFPAIFFPDCFLPAVFGNFLAINALWLLEDGVFAASIFSSVASSPVSLASFPAIFFANCLAPTLLAAGLLAVIALLSLVPDGVFATGNLSTILSSPVTSDELFPATFFSDCFGATGL